MKQILLVNPFPSAKYLSDRFAHYNITTIALYTLDLAKFTSYYIPSKNLFSEQFYIVSDDITAIVKKLGDKNFDYVLGCCEASVELSDKLAQYYSPIYANNPQNSFLRSNKYEVNKALSIQKISSIHQILYNIKEKLPIIEEFNINYPCFVKPLAGSSSIGASKIETQQDLVGYFQAPEKYNNKFQNDTNKNYFLIAEYVEGTEFIVDTFSVKGEHYISTIQKYKKETYNGRPIYRYWEIENDKKILESIENYIKKVLDAIEYKNGFAHTELFILQNGDIKLVEVNPRVSGASGMINVLQRLHNNQDVCSIFAEKIFKYKTITAYNGKYNRCLVILNLSGKPLYNLKNHLIKYHTLNELVQLVPDGSVIRDLNDVALYDAAAFVILSDTSIDKINNDTEAIFIEDKLGWNKIF